MHEASREDWLRNEPSVVTTSTNRHLLDPARDKSKKRQREIRQAVEKGKRRTRPAGKKESGSHVPFLGKLLRTQSSSSESAKSDRSQLVDLVVEDTQAEATERIRARKEGGSKWNEEEPKHYMYALPCRIQTTRTGCPS